MVSSVLPLSAPVAIQTSSEPAGWPAGRSLTAAGLLRLRPQAGCGTGPWESTDQSGAPWTNSWIPPLPINGERALCERIELCRVLVRLLIWTLVGFFHIRLMIDRGSSTLTGCERYTRDVHTSPHCLGGYNCMHDIPQIYSRSFKEPDTTYPLRHPLKARMYF